MPNNNNTKGRAATTDELADLHKLIANTISGELRSGNATPALLNVARQFLKDNGIDCVGSENKDVTDLLEDLPVYDTTDTDGSISMPKPKSILHQQ